MSEKDVVTGIVVSSTQPSAKLVPNSISFRIPSESPQPIIDITRPVQIIFAGDGHRGQYIETTAATIAGNIEADQKGIPRLTLQIITNAASYTHDKAVKTTMKISCPERWLQTRRGFHSDGNSAVAMEGEEVMVILPPVLQNTVYTQERLSLPTAPASINENPAPQIPSGNVNSLNSFIGQPLTDAQLEKAKKTLTNL